MAGPTHQPANDLLVRLDGISVKEADLMRVEHVDLSISRGEIVTLIGPNGSGKSTTAKVVTGVLKPSSGSVWHAPDLTIGYVPQKLNIDASLPMSVSRLMRLTGRYGRDKIAATLERVGISHLARRDVQGLSGGEFQRALLARALVRSPDLLVLDEPVQGVDFAGEIALYELISTIRDETGCGILMISHDLHVVMAETDTVICLNGHVCCTGSPETVSMSDEYLSLFGPRGQKNLAFYQHHHDHTHLPDGSVAHTHAHEHHHDHHHAAHKGDDHA